MAERPRLFNANILNEFLEKKGFNVYENSGRMIKFSKGKVEIRCGVDPEMQEIRSLYVGVDITNRLGVVF